jgi:hypothetical protein
MAEVPQTTEDIYKVIRKRIKFLETQMKGASTAQQFRDAEIRMYEYMTLLMRFGQKINEDDILLVD